MNEPNIQLTDGSPVTPDHREINPATGMQKGYVVLSPEERAKGFLRPVRQSYQHVGERPKYPVRELLPSERAEYEEEGYIAYEQYPESELPACGRYWTDKQLKSGCGTVTRMNQALAETYARDPKFYGGTFCAGCRVHFPVSQFIWEGTDQVVGS